MITSTIPAIPGDLGGRLRYYREIAGLSREYVSVQVGRGAGAIRDWELGKRPPRLTLLVQLAHLYSVPLTELVAGDS
jgi:transcriptional regulator with XRE-family HTH domain